MRQADGLDSVLEEERFERKLRKWASLNPAERRRKWHEIDAREKHFFFDHAEMNEEIDTRRKVETEWHRENPDGEYVEG